MAPPWQAVFLIVFVISGVLFWRRAVVALKQVFSKAKVAACLALGVVGTSWVIASQRIEALVFVAAAMVVVAVVLEAIDRRRERTATMASL